MLMLPMRDGQTNKRTTSEYRATQLLICEKLSLAISTIKQTSLMIRYDMYTVCTGWFFNCNLT